MKTAYAIKPRSEPPDGFVPLCFENHAQDSRVRLLGHYTLQLNAKDGTGGNNLPIILDFADRLSGLRTLRRRIKAECARLERDGMWPDDEWLDVGHDVILNVYIDEDGRRRATAFQNRDENLKFGIDIEYVGDGAVHE